MEFDIKPGVTAIIGGGGKTTLMMYLAKKYSELGNVIICTTTKIYQPEGIPLYQGTSIEELEELVKSNPIVCVGKKGVKLEASEIPMIKLMDIADYVFVEADGSKGMPLKVHAEWEPVIPVESNIVIWVIGADCFGKPLREVCHRYELIEQMEIYETMKRLLSSQGDINCKIDISKLCKQNTDDTLVTPQIVAAIILGEIEKKTELKNLTDENKIEIYVNKVETQTDKEYVNEMGKFLTDYFKVHSGSLMTMG